LCGLLTESRESGDATEMGGERCNDPDDGVLF